MQGAGLSPACRTSHPQGCVGAWHHPGMGNPIPGAPQDPQTSPCPLFGGEPASPHAQHTRAALPQPREMFGEGEKKKIPAAALGKPEDRLGALRLPLARGWLRAALHTPHPDPRHRGLLVLEGSSLYATPSARTLHTPALCTEAGHCHGPLLAPLEQRAQNTAHTHSPPPRIQPPPGRLPAASSSELY